MKPTEASRRPSGLDANARRQTAMLPLLSETLAVAVPQAYAHEGFLLLRVLGASPMARRRPSGLRARLTASTFAAVKTELAAGRVPDLDFAAPRCCRGSQAAAATERPSGLTATVRMGSVWPRREPFPAGFHIPDLEKLGVVAVDRRDRLAAQQSSDLPLAIAWRAAIKNPSLL